MLDPVLSAYVSAWHGAMSGSHPHRAFGPFRTAA